MTTESKAGGADSLVELVDRLHEESHRFDFFQAVRLLERLADESGDDDRLRERAGVGGNGPPSAEPVRFTVSPSLQFPPGMIAGIERREDYDARPLPPEMSVAMFGMLGPLGTLPRQYTETAVDRERGVKDETLGRFLDIVQHRAIGLFYRAWARTRMPIAVERARHGSGGGAGDPVSSALLAMLGGSGEEARRGGGPAAEGELPPDALLYYSGRLLAETGSAEAIENVVSDHFGVAAEVRQFQGRWAALPVETQTSMTPRGGNCALGRSTVSGSRVWDQTSLIRLRLGPLRRDQFDQFLPGRAKLRELHELVTRLAGGEFEVDVQLVLRAPEVPRCGFDGTAALGRNTWSKSGPFEKDTEDVVLRLPDALAA